MIFGLEKQFGRLGTKVQIYHALKEKILKMVDPENRSTDTSLRPEFDEYQSNNDRRLDELENTITYFIDTFESRMNDMQDTLDAILNRLSGVEPSKVPESQKGRDKSPKEVEEPSGVDHDGLYHPSVTGERSSKLFKAPRQKAGDTVPLWIHLKRSPRDLPDKAYEAVKKNPPLKQNLVITGRDDSARLEKLKDNYFVSL